MGQNLQQVQLCHQVQGFQGYQSHPVEVTCVTCMFSSSAGLHETQEIKKNRCRTHLGSRGARSTRVSRLTSGSLRSQGARGTALTGGTLSKQEKKKSQEKSPQAGCSDSDTTGESTFPEAVLQSLDLVQDSPYHQQLHQHQGNHEHQGHPSGERQG